MTISLYSKWARKSMIQEARYDVGFDALLTMDSNYSEFMAEVDNVMFWKFLEKTNDIHTSNSEGKFSSRYKIKWSIINFF